MMDLRSFLSEFEAETIRIKARVSTEYMAAAILKRFDGGPIVMFEDLEGFRAVGNVVGSRERLYKAFNASESNYHRKIMDAVSSPSPPKLEEFPWEEYVVLGGLNKLPVLKHYEGDGGRYITAGIVIAMSPDGSFQNESIHRLLILSDREMAIRVVPRHLYRMIMEGRRDGVPLKVAIAIGTHPAVMLAASTSPPYKVSHLWVANRLLENRLRVYRFLDGLIVPPAEIILYGEIDTAREVDEGPFTDLTGTLDIVRKQPVVVVKSIYARRDAIYQALLPAGSEHMLLMGLPREALIKSYLERVVPEVGKVRLTRGGCGWLHVVASIRKIREGDGKNAIMACFAAHPSLKMAVIVDDDIDPDDLIQVEWALATRFQADKDMVVISGATSSSLDPSGNQEIGLGAKLGLDATRPLNKPPEKFRRAEIPVSPAEVEEFLRGAMV